MNKNYLKARDNQPPKFAILPAGRTRPIKPPFDRIAFAAAAEVLG